ncbi:MAG: hypothetical protein ABIN89_16595 [Chitinophagaceae bacterium]
MKSALVIFNGIKFPYYLMEYALAQAKENKAAMHLVFLRARKENSESYGFPSDLEATEEKSAVEDDEKYNREIIIHHMKLANDMVASEGITCKTELQTDCSIEEISHLMKNFDVVYIDADYDNENTSLLGNEKFSLSELIEEAPSKIKLVSEDGTVI